MNMYIVKQSPTFPEWNPEGKGGLIPLARNQGFEDPRRRARSYIMSRQPHRGHISYVMHTHLYMLMS